MNRFVKKAIIKAVLTDFELGCIAGVAVILADMMWLAHDIATNGFSFMYGVIGTTMVIGFSATIAVIVRHNLRKSSTYLKAVRKAGIRQARKHGKER